jgi:hypothetical protein
MNNSRSQRRSSHPRERDSNVYYSDEQNGRSNYYYRRSPEEHSPGTREDNERDSRGRLVSHQDIRRNQERFDYENSGREFRPDYSDRRSDYGGHSRRNGTDDFERSNEYAEGRPSRWHDSGQDRNARGRYSTEYADNRGYSYDDGDLEREPRSRFTGDYYETGDFNYDRNRDFRTGYRRDYEGGHTPRYRTEGQERDFSGRYTNRFENEISPREEDREYERESGRRYEHDGYPR